ncbi:MAG: DVUA0089 family protein [Thermoleophilaceae bacterium]
MRHSIVTTALAALALLGGSPAATAATEQGDAGDLLATAQDLSREGVERIDGSFAGGADVDMYRLCLPGGGTFSASTIGGATGDTQLFLFDEGGRGVYANDDANRTRQSVLPAGHSLTPQAAGGYFLAVGPYNQDPESSLGPIFPDLASLVGPTGSGGGEPVAGWSGRSAGSGAYSIFLSGAECTPPDTTPPTVVIHSPADGALVGRGDAVVVDFSCADEGGSGLASCVGTVPDGGVLDTSEAGPASVTVTARDNAGNQAAVTHAVTVVDPDRAPPRIELLAPLDGAVYLLEEEVRADYSCADEPGGSGLARCTGDVPDGSPVDTGSVGRHEFTVDAADLAGNLASVTHSYRVVYDFEGFLPPVRNRPDVNTLKAGRRVPIRFELGGDRGLEVVEEGWPRVAEVSCELDEEPEDGQPARHPRWFRELAFRRRKQRYVMQWKTDRDWAGSCRQFMLKLNDGTVKRADFRFVRRGHGGDGDGDGDS